MRRNLTLLVVGLAATLSVVLLLSRPWGGHPTANALKGLTSIAAPIHSAPDPTALATPDAPPRLPLDATVLDAPPPVDVLADAPEFPGAVARAPVRESGPCTRLFPGPPATLEDATAATVIDGFEPKTHRFTPRDAGPASPGAFPRFEATACDGSRVLASEIDGRPAGSVQVVLEPIAGPRALLETKGLAGVLVAKVIVGGEPGLCSNELGFVALVVRDPRAIELLAVGPWQGGCAGPRTPTTAIAWGDSVALLQEDNSGGEDAVVVRYRRPWLLSGRRLVSLDPIVVEVDTTRGDGEPEDVRTMTSTLDRTPDGIVAHEKWTTRRARWLPDQGVFETIAGHRPRRREVERFYAAVNDHLHRVPDSDPDDADD